MNKTVLIVDDEPRVRLSYRVALETDGFDVHEADGAAAALAELAQYRFALVILDMRMPEMDGLNLLEKIRGEKVLTPVVIITAYGDIPHAVRAMKLGAIDFLQKPLTPDVLRSIAWEIVSRHAPAASGLTENATFEMHLNEAKRFINLRDFPHAREHIAAALEIRTDSADLFNLAGVLFEMLENYDRAKRYYGQAIRLSRDHEPAQQNMRRIYELFQFGSSKEPFHLGSDS
jgi:FixJ family two-component response regulator